MAIKKHPITGVTLNVIEIERTSVDYSDAVTIHLMKASGEKYSAIAHQLGTNPARIGEVLRGDIHPRAAAEAATMTR